MVLVYAIIPGVHRGSGELDDTLSTIDNNSSISSNNADGTKL